MDKNDLIYLDTYVLQKDMRVRMPKCILENLNAKKGYTKFKIYFDKSNSQLILKVDNNNNLNDEDCEK